MSHQLTPYRRSLGQWSALTVSSCLMHSMVASSALVPRVASSSTAFTVFRRDVTLVTMTCEIKEVTMRLTVKPGGGALSPQLQNITFQNVFFPPSNLTDLMNIKDISCRRKRRLRGAFLIKRGWFTAGNTVYCMTPGWKKKNPKTIQALFMVTRFVPSVPHSAKRTLLG